MGFERAGFGYTDTGKPEVRGYGRRWFAWGLSGSDRELRILAGVQMYSAMCEWVQGSLDYACEPSASLDTRKAMSSASAVVSLRARSTSLSFAAANCD